MELKTVLDLTNDVIDQESAQLNAYIDGMRFNILILEKLANLVRMDLNSSPNTIAAMAENAVGLHEIRKYKIICDCQQYSNGVSPLQFWKNFSREMSHNYDLHAWNVEESPESSSCQLDGGSDSEADIETEAEDEIE
ncbi:unnamed protein product [Orchesella dallaii]|uniref:Uncharacterized protein n=1 Tax=Orchesella dallaii TaxID=48710 RepID=A0ABP1RH60_9HEXA